MIQLIIKTAKGLILFLLTENSFNINIREQILMSDDDVFANVFFLRNLSKNINFNK